MKMAYYHIAPLLQAIRLLVIWQVQQARLMIRMELRKRVHNLICLADHKEVHLGDPSVITYLDKEVTVKSTKMKRLLLKLALPSLLSRAGHLRPFHQLYSGKLGQHM